MGDLYVRISKKLTESPTQDLAWRLLDVLDGPTFKPLLDKLLEAIPDQERKQLDQLRSSFRKKLEKYGIGS